MLAQGTDADLKWAVVLPLLATVPAVAMALYVSLWWFIVLGTVSVAVGRYVAWRRAAQSSLNATAEGLVARRGAEVTTVPWDDVKSVSLWPGSSAPRWSFGPTHGYGALPDVVITRRRTTRGGPPLVRQPGPVLGSGQGRLRADEAGPRTRL